MFNLSRLKSVCACTGADYYLVAAHGAASSQHKKHHGLGREGHRGDSMHAKCTTLAYVPSLAFGANLCAHARSRLDLNLRKQLGDQFE